ncbi:MAG: glycosyltransferase family 9 protein [Bacteroidetes bacterium]|nr:glycosyltransferase family 9 protein [Bacteroidota bacterium]MCW5896102.1 glycosyltransferase family 9 protein [Bacteroidota bacterium]
MDPEQVRSLLIVELTRLGDVVTMLPSITLLANHFSNAKLVLLVDSQYEPLLTNLGLPCKIWGVRNPESIFGFLKVLLSVRKMHIDLALSMSPPKRNAAVTLVSGARSKVGYLTYRHTLTPYLEVTPVESFGLALAKEESYGLQNIEERGLKVCRALGISGNYLRAESGIQLEHNIFEKRRQRLISDGLVPDRKFVVVHPFSGWKYRSWSLERFGDVVSTIVTRLNYDAVLLCDKSEEEKLDLLQQRFAGRHNIHFVASDDLLDTCVILKEASLFLGNDSGPLHLASALGTRVVGLFGPASPELTAPRNDAGKFLFRIVECSPCAQLHCERPSNSCMSLISQDDVLQAVMEQLSLVPEAKAVANA